MTDRPPFRPKFVDLVRNFTHSVGTGPVVLGPAVSGYTSLAAFFPGDQFYYCIQGLDHPLEREVGRGTLTANGLVERQPIQGELTDFSPGTKTIAIVAAADWMRREPPRPMNLGHSIRVRPLADDDSRG